MAILLGEKTTISIGGATAGVYSISGPEITMAEIERSVLGTKYKEYRVANQYDAGTVEVSIYFDPTNATHETLATWQDDDPIAEKTCTITLSDSSTIAFDAMPTSIKFEGMEIDTDLSLVLNLRIIGEITITIASGE